MSDELLQSFTRDDLGDTTLLGAPLFRGPVLDRVWSDRCDDLSRAVSRLRHLCSQDAEA